MNLSIVVRAYNEAEHIEGSIVLPGVTLAEGAGVGALSLVKEDVGPFEMVGGVPARRIGTRARTVLELEGKLRREGTDPGV